jgi:hypothetical protein
MMGAPDHVMLKPLLHFGHNYNYVSRAAMYPWFNRHFKLGLKEPIVEEDYRLLSRAELSVWDQEHPKPQGGPEFERKLLRYLTEGSEKLLEPARDSLAGYREVVGGAVDVLLGRNLSEVGEVKFNETSNEDRGDYQQIAGLLRNQTHGEELPLVMLHPKNVKNRAVIWVEESGKSALFAGHEPAAEIRKLIDAGTVVVGVDLLFQGEFLADGQPVAKTRRVNNPREFAGFTFGYNRCLFAQRVQDLLSVIRYAQSQVHKDGTLAIAGFGGAGPWVAAAAAQSRDALRCAAVDTAGFRFGKILDFQAPDFLPGGAKYGDLPGIIALCAPTRIWLAGEGEQAPELVRALYAKANAQAGLTIYHGDQQKLRWSAVQFLLE